MTHHDDFISLRRHLTTEERKNVAFMLKYLAQNSDTFSESDITILTSIESQFNHDGCLSDKQYRLIQRKFEKA